MSPPQATRRRAGWGAPAIGLIGLAVGSGTLPIGDADTLWHVQLGQRLWQTWQFVGPAPRPGLLSGDYVYTQWLPELVASGAYAVWGLPGVAVLAQLVRLGLVAALYLVARREGGSLASALAAFLALAAALGALTARPQLLGVLLLAVAVGGWRASARDARARWWLVPLLWVWGASHGTWTVGVAVGAVALAAAALRERPRRWSRWRGPALVWALGAIVPLLGPVSPATVVRAFLDIRAISWFAEEWRPAGPTSPQLLPFLALVALTVAGWIRRRRMPAAVDVAFLALALALALPAYRGIALGAVVLLPVAARAWAADPPAHAADPARPARAELALLALPLVAALAWSVSAAPSVAAAPTRVPAALAPALRALPAGTVVFDDVALGGWLLWDQPGLVPVLDTRLEAYGSDYLQAYVDALAARPGWPATLARLGARAALLDVGAPLTAALRTAGWQEAGRDHGGATAYVLLVSP